MSDRANAETAAERWLLVVLKGAMVFFGLSLALLILATVIMRYGMSNPFLAIEEAAALLGIWLYFMSGAYVTGTRAHICGGALDLIVTRERHRRYVRFMGSAVCLFVASVAFYYAWQYGWFTMEKGRKSTYLQWPRMLWVAGMVAGFALIVFFLMMQTIRDFRSCRGTGKEAV
ncbi:TRAP transporter small permease [Paracoccus sp. SCSIO 75233]|uniref:TRAP transporter small permease n=1 Tax=Paracoccus sp. SCSIO 75233 TaxID=3017782 RepID=UPI0022F0164F|nr:TRAP transporter small permease [Paracoccus sp. SCSIO 75233]WBU52835.1 TRAP transporter small permease [Paracoccus sp. SCSIO 75233]